MKKIVCFITTIFLAIMISSHTNTAFASQGSVSASTPISCDTFNGAALFRCAALSLRTDVIPSTSLAASTVLHPFWNTATNPIPSSIPLLFNQNITSPSNTTFLDSRLYLSGTGTFSNTALPQLMFLGDGITPNIHVEFPTLLPSAAVITLSIRINGFSLNYANYSVVGGSASKQYIDILMPNNVWFNNVTMLITSSVANIPATVQSLFIISEGY